MKARRSKVLAILATLAIGGLVLGACALQAPAPVPTPQPTVAAPTPVPTPKPAVAPAEEKPRYGGILRIGVDTGLPGYDPHAYPVTAVSASVFGFFNGAVWYDPMSHLEPKVIPDLAQRWDMSPDGRVYTFYLHKEVKFHDGTPVTAKDVVFSLNKIMNPVKGIPSPRKEFLYAVEKVEAVDDYAVRITLKFPSGSFLDNLAAPTILVVPKDYLEKGGYSEGKNILNKKPIGSGPFMLKEHISGVSLEAVKNPDYFKKGLPYLDGYVVYVIPDAGARLAALRTERIHTIPYTLVGRPEEEALLKKDLGERIVTWHQFRDFVQAVFTLNHKRKPFDDLRVRKAIRLALNNEEFFQVAVGGLGTPSGPMAREFWALPKEELQKYPGFEPDYEARLAEARKLLTEAGFPKGFTMNTIGAAPRWHNINTMQYGATALRRIGIEVKLVPQEVGAFYENLRGANYDSSGTSHGATTGDPDGIFGGFFTSWGGLNYAHYRNPKIDELYEQQARELDPMKRREIVWEMQRIVLRDVAWPMFGPLGNIANRLASVRGSELTSTFVNYFNMRYETNWLAE